LVCANDEKSCYSKLLSVLRLNQYFLHYLFLEDCKSSDFHVAYFEETFLLHVMRAQWKKGINFALQQHYVTLQWIPYKHVRKEWHSTPINTEIQRFE